MKIEVKAVEGRKEHLIIFIDGEKWKVIHRAIFGKTPKLPSSSVEMEWKEQFQQLEYQRTKNYIIWRLSAQPYHSKQLAKLLKKRFVSDHVIDRAIQDCEDKGFLNDEMWVDNFIKNHKKRMGLPAILRKLQAKGLEREELREIQEKSKNPEDERSVIQNLLSTKYRTKNLKDYRERQKVVASLMRKGFSYDLIISTLQM